MRWVASLITICFSVQLCLGAVIHVPGNQPTIQAGIDASASGDTVQVAEGTYSGEGNREIDFGGKNIVLVSENGPENTIIDCDAGPSDAHWAVYLHNGEDSSSIIDGFTITNAYSDELGAIYIDGSSPTIRNCIIRENDCSGLRIRGSGANPKIADCEIYYNSIHGIELSDVLWPTAGIEMIRMLVYGNGQSGIYIYSAADLVITNCTFAENGDAGVFIEGDPPKGLNRADLTRVISNCISAYNQGSGFTRVFFDTPYSYYCNNSYGNDEGNYTLHVYAYPGDPNGNIAVPPLFCDEPVDSFHIHESSPCAPANNDCEVLIGARDIGCYDYLCGDVNGNEVVAEIGDLIVLQGYIPGWVHSEAPLVNSDVDFCGKVNMADMAMLFQHITGMSVGMCEPNDTCYLTTGGNSVTLGCPVEVPLPVTDSVPLPIYISNDTTLVALSLGFSYDSDLVHVTSIDTTGTVLPSGWNIALSQPSDGEYVHAISDSNILLIAGWTPELGEKREFLQAQLDGLLATLWIQIDDPGAAYHAVDIDSAFLYPAGEFIFCPVGRGAILPDYYDCGTADLIIGDYVCGDADASGEVDIDDVVYLISYIFSAGPEPLPYESGDANCVGGVDIDDVVWLIAYIFSGGNPPCDTNGDEVPDC
jgi:parallel beta-helix repeat protein